MVKSPTGHQLENYNWQRMDKHSYCCGLRKGVKGKTLPYILFKRGYRAEKWLIYLTTAHFDSI